MDPKRDGGAGARGREPKAAAGAQAIARSNVVATAAIVTLIAYLGLAHTLLGAAAPELPFLSLARINPVQLVGLITFTLVVGAGMSADAALWVAIGLVVTFLGIVFLVTWRLSGAIASAPAQRERARRNAALRGGGAGKAKGPNRKR